MSRTASLPPISAAPTPPPVSNYKKPDENPASKARNAIVFPKVNGIGGITPPMIAPTDGATITAMISTSGEKHLSDRYTSFIWDWHTENVGAPEFGAALTAGLDLPSGRTVGIFGRALTTKNGIKGCNREYIAADHTDWIDRDINGFYTNNNYVLGLSVSLKPGTFVSYAAEVNATEYSQVITNDHFGEQSSSEKSGAYNNTVHYLMINSELNKYLTAGAIVSVNNDLKVGMTGTLETSIFAEKTSNGPPFGCSVGIAMSSERGFGFTAGLNFVTFGALLEPKHEPQYNSSQDALLGFKI